MRGLPPIARAETFRVRRWDAVVLGGALPGLIATIRLAKRGLRVLLIEEEAALRGFQGAREPFCVVGTEAEDVLGSCLRALGVPLIDQRRFAPRDVALQVALPDARVDVGRAGLTADEFTAWGLSKPDAARDLLRALEEASEAERHAMLDAPVVRVPSRLPRAPRRGSPGPAVRRGLPGELLEAPGRVRTLFGAQLRALSNLGATAPSPEAQARLAGCVLRGGTALGGGDGWLRGMLRRRIQSLFGEFRTVSGPIRLVSVANQPGLAIGDSDEIWAGRLLLLNAPRTALAGAMADEVPDFLRVPAPRRRRVSIHLRGPRSVLPGSMAESVVLVRDPAQPLDGVNCISIRTFSSGRGDADVIASAVAPLDRRRSEVQVEIEAGVRELVPFSEELLQREPLPSPRWDTESLLEDPAGGAGWPREASIRLSSRPTVLALDRSQLAGLGFEGDVLMGWRGGDVAAAELA